MSGNRNRPRVMNWQLLMPLLHLINESELREDYIVPDPFDERVVTAVTQAVSKAAIESGVSTLFLLSTNRK